MSQADRLKTKEETAHRIKVLDDIKRVGLHKWLKWAGEHDLPSDPGRCSTEQLALAVAALLVPQTAPGGATTMALKSKGSTKAAVAGSIPRAKSYLVTFPTTKPQKATGVVLEGDAPEAAEGTTQFVANSAKDLAGAPMPALLALINAGKSGTLVRKMTSEDSAQQTAWDALTTRAEKPAADGAAKEAKPRAIKVVSFDPKAKEEIKQVRVGTKVATAIDLLSQTGGVLLSEFEAELSKTGKPISGRAWLGYDVAKVVGYGVKSEVEGDDLRLFIVLPKGMKAPLAHKTAEEKPKAEPKPKKAVAEAPKSKVAEPVAASIDEHVLPDKPAKKAPAKGKSKGK